MKILDTTLRDGSYAVNFSFTSVDVVNICRDLESAGIYLIEIGHGVGLGASKKGYGYAVQTDEEYLDAARSILKMASFGMFCIPGIADIEDVDMAASKGMGFIRIGTDVDKITQSEMIIKRAKKHKMVVMANYMKSYAMPPEGFAENVLRSQDYGADIVYLVDSSGGMFPDDINRYYEAIRKVSSISLGFHGHDNLGLGVANSLRAIELGFVLIDGSLQGLGRSSGNAATELLAAALLKQERPCGADFLMLCEAGQKYIQPLITNKGRMPLDIVAGYADFHSSYMHHIRKYAVKYGVDPALLIIEYCKINKINIDEIKLDSIACQIKKNKDIYLGKYDFSKYFGSEQENK